MFEINVCGSCVDFVYEPKGDRWRCKKWGMETVARGVACEGYALETRRGLLWAKMYVASKKLKGEK